MLSTRILNLNNQTFTVPDDWSDNAATIFVDKYCRSYITQRQTRFKETSVAEVFRRLVQFWVYEKEERDLLFEDLWYQRASPNSPQYFNAGISRAYDVEGSDIGLWHYVSDKAKSMRTKSTFRYPQLHACFIQPIVDSIGGIIYLLSNEARLFSRGSGTGTNFSNLRGKGEHLAGGGTSSGLISFLKIFDTMAGAIKSGGTTRRAAKMVVVNVDHPDIIEFIRWKSKEEAKAKVLAKAGYGDGWQSESYTTVTGQNANNSVSIPDKFMFALESNDEWELVGRVDKTVSRRIPAADIWQAICESAWFCADPGIHYTDTINQWNTTPKDGRIKASNPCSEHLRLDYSACNLASLNLCAFWHSIDLFNIDLFIETTRRWVDVLDRSIDLAGYPSKDICDTTQKFRDIGLGFCSLGALLLRLRLPYDSEEARSLASLLASLLTATSYLRSAELAEQQKPYPRYRPNRDAHLNVMVMHHKAFIELKNNASIPPHLQMLFDGLIRYCDRIWLEAYTKAKEHGLRNAQLTVIAPTGTIGITMDGETTGIEPLFALNTNKELAGGGSLNQSSPSLEIAIAQEGEFNPDNPLFATAVGDNALSPEAHVSMVARVQPHVSGGISKTVNLPSTATFEDIDRIYRLAYKEGVKCISVYRDGSKSQPLTADCKTCSDDEACEITPETEYMF